MVELLPREVGEAAASIASVGLGAAALAAVLLVGGEEGPRLTGHVRDESAVALVGGPARHGKERDLLLCQVVRVQERDVPG